MRIASVHTEILDIPFREPLVSGAHRWDRRRTGIILLTSDTGLEALGEYPAVDPGPGGEDVAGRLAGELEGIHLADPVSIERALRRIDAWPLVGRAARSAVESALVDLLARVSGRPVSAFLGGEPAPDVAVNAVLGIIGPQEAASQAAALAADGYRCLKLKAGDEPDGALERRVAAVRAAVGPGVALRLDFNGSLSVEGAEDTLARLADHDIEYVEQPISSTAGVEALARLRWVSAVPLAADESVRDLGAARALLDAAAVDVLVVKPARVGGLRQAHSIIDVATAAGVTVTVSTLFETGVGIAGALHLAATVPGGHAHGLATGELLGSDLLARPLSVIEGRMAVPQAPGLGIELDPAALARYRVP